MSQDKTQEPLENNNLSKKDIFTPLLLSVAVVIGIGVGLKLKNEVTRSSSVN